VATAKQPSKTFKYCDTITLLYMHTYMYIGICLMAARPYHYSGIVCW